MLAQGQNFVTLSPWTCVFPGVALALTALAFNQCGDVLRERLDPRGLAR
jgi:peptide/nickel transport system permease protein